MGKSIFIRVISTVLVVLFVSIWITPTDWNTGKRQLPQMAPVYRVEAVEERAGTRADSRRGENTDVAAIRRVLRAGLAKIEEDVLTLDIGKIVGSVGNETTLHNRLLAKLQGPHLQRPERCVIRIAFQCKNFFTQNLQTMDRFTCSPSLPLPCDIERQFVVNITSDILRMSDVVIFGLTAFEGQHIDELIRERPHGQLWAFATANPPTYREDHVPNTPGAENPYNLSMTNAHESDLYSPYWRFEEQPVSRVPPLRNKTKLVAWMASRCVDTAWRRTDFVKYMQTYLDIDIYGVCSGMGRLPRGELAEATLQQYKFYLSFENSECREYITEKVARNAFSNGVVPIVYGSRPQDYARMLPANSYIDLHEFNSIGDFVNYLQALDNDIPRYNKFFNWHERGVIETVNLNQFMKIEPAVNICYLLRKFLHLSIHPETAWQKKTPDFGAWQRGRCSIGGPNKVLGFDIHAP